MNTGHEELPAGLHFWVRQSYLERLLFKHPRAGFAILILLILGTGIYCWFTGTRLSFDILR